MDDFFETFVARTSWVFFPAFLIFYVLETLSYIMLDISYGVKTSSPFTDGIESSQMIHLTFWCAVQVLLTLELGA